MSVTISSQPADIDGVRSELAHLADKHRVPGGALCVFHEGATLLEQAFGVLRKDEPTPIVVNTVFEAGSLAKPVFAHWLLLQASTGRFELDRPVIEYFRNGDYPAERWGRIESRPVFMRKLTARMILCHTSGLGNWQSDRINRFSFAPGSEFRYSGEAFTLLQRAVEHHFGTPVAPLIDREVFQRLDMNDSALVHSATITQRAAHGHGKRNVGVGSKWSEGAVAYSLYTTAPDYARFVQHVLSLSSGSAAPMVQPTVQVTPQVSWTLGWGHQADPTAIFQWGDLGDFTALALAVPEFQAGLVLLTNGSRGLRLAEDIAPRIFKGRHACFEEFIFDKKFSD